MLHIQAILLGPFTLNNGVSSSTSCVPPFKMKQGAKRRVADDLLQKYRRQGVYASVLNNNP